MHIRNISANNSILVFAKASFAQNIFFHFITTHKKSAQPILHAFFILIFIWLQILICRTVFFFTATNFLAISLCVRRGGACSSRLTNTFKTLMSKEETNALEREEQIRHRRTSELPSYAVRFLPYGFSVTLDL